MSNWQKLNINNRPEFNTTALFRIKEEPGSVSTNYLNSIVIDRSGVQAQLLYQMNGIGALDLRPIGNYEWCPIPK